MVLAASAALVLSSSLACHKKEPIVLERVVATPIATHTPRPTATPRPVVPSHTPTVTQRPDVAPRADGEIRTVDSTAYCELGGMANGQHTYWGAVAMNTAPMGSQWRILSGSWAGHVVTVADHIGWGSDFDIAMPGDCAGADNYGRQSIRIERVA